MDLNSFNINDVKKKIITAAVLFLLFCAGLIYLILMPAINSVKSLRAEIITQKIDLEKKLAREQNMQLLSGKLNTIEPQMKKFDQIFINQNRELEFIIALESIALKNNTAQKINLNPDSAQIEQCYKKIPLNINATGEFDHLMRYLADLETLNYYINIKSINISANQSAPSSHSRPSLEGSPDNPVDTINLKISADTYWK